MDALAAWSLTGRVRINGGDTMAEDEQQQGYTQWAPPAAMADAVDAFWQFWVPRHPQQGAPLRRQHRVLPDGCTDLIFDFHHAPGPAWLASSRLGIVGPMKRFVLVDLEPGAVSLGVRLRPGWAQALLGVSPRELCGLNVTVQDCAPALAQLQRRMEDCATPAHAMTLLQDTITQRWTSFRDVAKPRAVHALAHLQSCEGQVRMTALAHSLGVSERTLHRDILDEAGIAPKLLARVLRFQRAVSLLRANGGAALCDVALECGYADQAHLSRDVRELAGVSPSTLVG
ncbi:Transcriptional regulator, AraC family [Myxococcus hansupus]|uniref:Transcriptional regulator, AraC family n=1 Tax=Pseudomyxococcus hansupus TaxID=1297742 RepID=A0A0H4X7Z7_9BACT|nr:helix-turn-helix domain-containing protein [Myxococcus hansupus]AKQ69695.1 Transcriptional regulator, AraC family [Myxococcus hansupus]